MPVTRIVKLGFFGAGRGVEVAGSGWRSGALAGAFEEAMGWYSFRKKEARRTEQKCPELRIFDHRRGAGVPGFFNSTRGIELLLWAHVDRIRPAYFA